jgi:hypothetical protein
MSYNVSAFYVAETFIKNRLNALLKPIVRNLSGGNAPLIKSNDSLSRRFTKSNCKMWVKDRLERWGFPNRRFYERDHII